MAANEHDHARPPAVAVKHERDCWVVEVAAANGSRQRYVCASESSARNMQRAFERAGVAMHRRRD